MVDRISSRKVLFVDSFGLIKHVQVRKEATWNTASGEEKQTDLNISGEWQD